MPDSKGKKDSCLHKIKKVRGLKIASLNVNSLLRHVDELRLMLSDSEIDVFAINESKIDNSVKDSEISIPGYNMIRKDRNRFGGGVVVYIRETYSFYERKNLNSDDLEMICIESSNIGADRSGFLRVRKGAEGALINIHTNEGA